MGGEVRARVRQVSGSTSEASARGHQSLVDRPEAKGGSDRGPMGGELMLMGIGGCFMSNLLAAVKAREVEVADLVVDVMATIDDGPPPRFSQIALVVSGRYADPETMRELVALAERSCISVNTVKPALRLKVELA